MNGQQTMAAFLVMILIGLSLHEYWAPEWQALLG